MYYIHPKGFISREADNKILILFLFLLPFIFQHLFYFALVDISICPSVLFAPVSFSAPFCFLPHLYTSFFSLFFYNTLPPSPSFPVSFHAIHLFPCRRVQGAGKSVMSDIYIAGFTDRLSNSTRDFLFPRSWRATSSGLFCSAILSGTISPMHFDDRGPFDAWTNRAIPVPSGIRLSLSLSL